MAGHAFKRTLIHTGVHLEAGTARSSSGELTRDWANAATATVSCRFVHRTHNVANPTLGFMMAHEHLLLVDSAAKGTISEEGRWRNFTDSNGSAIAEAAGTWRVESLIPSRTTKLHHYELRLERVE